MSVSYAQALRRHDNGAAAPEPDTTDTTTVLSLDEDLAKATDDQALNPNAVEFTPVLAEHEDGGAPGADELADAAGDLSSSNDGSGGGSGAPSPLGSPTPASAPVSPVPVAPPVALLPLGVLSPTHSAAVPPYAPLPFGNGPWDEGGATMVQTMPPPPPPPPPPPMPPPGPPPPSAEGVVAGGPGGVGAGATRTVFVGGVDPQAEDARLVAALEKYGPVRVLHQDQRHVGVLLVTFYDMRHAERAVHSLAADGRYALSFVPTPEWLENHGTIVVFGTEPPVGTDALREACEAIGPVLDIREAPTKRAAAPHKFVEFFDTRDAEQAVQQLNKAKVDGCILKVEISRVSPPRKGAAAAAQAQQQFAAAPAGMAPHGMHHPGLHHPMQAPPPPPPPHQVDPYSGMPLLWFGPHGQPMLPPGQGPMGPMQGGAPPPEFMLPPNVAAMHHAHMQAQAHFAAMHPAPLLSLGGKPGGRGGGGDGRGGKGRAGEGRRGRGDGSRGGGGGKTSEEEKGMYAFSMEEAVQSGGSGRTTLMIKNIPNKYSQRMLLSVLERRYAGQYDFFYLPIDFKNRCNLGYAFVNFASPATTAEFYAEFHTKRWEEFNSKKVCEITYARVQGRNALIEHFRNSRFPCENDEYLPLVFELGSTVGMPLGSIQSRAAAVAAMTAQLGATKLGGPAGAAAPQTPGQAAVTQSSGQVTPVAVR